MNIVTLEWVSIFAISAMAVNGIGIFVMYKNSEWASKHKEHFMCFAAGMLITSALVHAFPEAVEQTHFAGFAAVAGFMFMWLINKGAKNFTSDRNKAFGATALAGIGIHSLMDGIIYSVTFSASIATGMAAGVGLVAHEFAEGVMTFSMLIKAGVNKKKAFIVAFFVAALTTPVGAFISFPLIQTWTTGMTGLALGFVTGVLIYTSASHLLPEVENGNHSHSHISLFLGVSLAILLAIVGH